MKTYVPFLCLICIFCGLHPESKAQGIQAQATLDSTSIRLGSQSMLHLRVELPVKESVSFPEIGDSLSSSIKVADLQKPDTILSKNNPGYHIINQNIRITSFDTGLHQIAPFTFKTRSGEIKTSALQIMVTPVAVDTSKSIYDIKQPIAVPFSLVEWIEEHVGLLVLIALGILLLVAAILYYRRKKGLLPPPEPEKLLPPHELAIKKLNVLRAKKLDEQDDIKEYHSELSIIMREYLEKRYPINAQEQATEEIFAGLKNLKMPAEARKDLHEVLTLSDFVKFAKGLPSADENVKSMDHALSFVLLTKLELVVESKKEPELKNDGGKKNSDGKKQKDLQK